MVKLTLDDNILHVTQDPAPGRVSLPLDALRVLLLFTPARFRSHLVEIAAERSLVSLEELAADDLVGLIHQLSTRKTGTSQFRFFLESYTGHFASITLQEINESGTGLLEEMARHREARREKLADWARNAPGLIIMGAAGDVATLDTVGVRASRGRFMAWADLELIESEPGPARDVDTYRFVPQRGSPGKAFSLCIPREKADLFRAECVFWSALARRQAERERQRVLAQ